MGHDINAYTGKNHNVREIAYLRFSAFDSTAISIYDALDARRAYAGCSGAGIGKPFTQQNILDGILLLQNRGDDHYINVTREPNVADALSEVLADVSGVDQIISGQSYSSVNRSIDFLKDILKAMELEDLDEVQIFFG